MIIIILFNFNFILFSYLAAGIYVGSCIYSDLCKTIEHFNPDFFNPTACPPELADFGIDCTCPFNIRSGLIEFIDQDLIIEDHSTATTLGFNNLLFNSGDYDVIIKTEDASGPFASVRIQYTVKPK